MTPTKTPTPTARLLRAALLLGPLVYLAADTTYAARGWDDATAGALHVVGAIGYGLMMLHVAGLLAPTSRLAAALVGLALVGAVGNAAYGFEAIHLSLGDVQLVDQPGAAHLIKPLGLAFPAGLALVAAALWRTERRWQGVLVLVATLGWPVTHIANVATLAVPVNIALVVALGSLAWAPDAPSGSGSGGSAGATEVSPRTAPSW